jgi:hypothetical protein
MHRHGILGLGGGSIQTENALSRFTQHFGCMVGLKDYLYPNCQNSLLILRSIGSGFVIMMVTSRYSHLPGVTRKFTF